MGLGPIMLDLAGTALAAEDRRRLLYPATGGVILFTRNFESPAQLKALVEEIHALRQPRLLVAVDHEGGRVQRFREGFTRLPAVARFGEVYARDAKRALELASLGGWLMAAELRDVGIDLSFAPVLDLRRGISGVIGDRAFHSDPEVIVRLAQAYAAGMREGGLCAVGKHFPGHGSIREDSHVAHPVDTRRWADIVQEDLRPFTGMIERGIEALMAAHVVYPDIDARPAGFSRRWISGILRGELGFKGAVFTDDLSMAAADVMGDYPARARAALEAGCDMALVCNHPEAADAVLDAIGPWREPASQLRIARLRAHAPADPTPLRQTLQWRRAEAAMRALADGLDEPELQV